MVKIYRIVWGDLKLKSKMSKTYFTISAYRNVQQ